MAERRMLTKNVTDDEDFLHLSSSAQALYLHLSMSADDDGFTKQISTSMFKAHASVQDLEALLAKRFVFQFESGVIVIRHWRMANALRQDRHKDTTFQEELAMLNLDKTGKYDWQPSGNQVATKCQPLDAIEENRIDKDSIDKRDNRFAPPTVDEVDVYAAEKGLRIDAQRFVDFYESKGWMVGKNKMKDWKAAVRGWCSRNDGQPTAQRSAKVQAAYGFSTERKYADGEINKKFFATGWDDE